MPSQRDNTETRGGASGPSRSAPAPSSGACRDLRESFLIRLWTEPDDDDLVLRGFIQNVRTGHKTYFDRLDLPVELLRESVERLGDDAPVSLR